MVVGATAVTLLALFLTSFLLERAYVGAFEGAYLAEMLARSQNLDRVFYGNADHAFSALVNIHGSVFAL
jgi:hypothetical protein